MTPVSFILTQTQIDDDDDDDDDGDDDDDLKPQASDKSTQMRRSLYK